MKVAVYIRVNSLEQAGVERQRDSIKEYCKKNGLICEKEFVDYCSGIQVNRKAFESMKKELTSGKYGAVVVSDISRISRNVSDVLEFYRELGKKGIELHTSKDGVFASRFNSTSFMTEQNKSLKSSHSLKR